MKNNTPKKKDSVLTSLILDATLLAVGICLIIWTDRVTSAIAIALGVIFLIAAAYNFIAYARNANTNNNFVKIMTPIALAIAGVFLIAQNGFLKELISIIVGIAVTIISIFKIQDSLSLKGKNGEYKLPLILSCICLICGILCIVGQISPLNFVLRALGVVMVIFAFLDITSSFTIKKSEKTIEETAIEAEVISEKKEN